MTQQHKVLKLVKETFNIFNDGRRYNPAPQKFLLSALADVLSSSATRERIQLNEAIGYFGHRIRELTGKMRPSEVEMIEQGGKLAAVNVIPAIRTKSVVVDKAGNVTHEQEFLDTDTGRAALSCYESGSGGFSWAMSGSNGHNTEQGSVARSFSGFDFVNQPNFIPLHRQSQLLSNMGESADTMLLSAMGTNGVDKDTANTLLNAFNAGGIDAGADEINSLLLSSLVAKQEQREQLLSSVIDNSVFFISERQRTALLNCNAGDAEVLNGLFSAMKNTDTQHLPIDVSKQEQASVGTIASNQHVMSYPNFENKQVQFK